MRSHRFALSLSLLVAMAPAAWAEGTRSLGVTVSPVGAVAASGKMAAPVELSAGLSWSVSHQGPVSVAGHVSTSAPFTQVTPLSLRLAPFGESAVRPFVGAGLGLLLAHRQQDGSPVRLGPEVSAGVDLDLNRRLFASVEGRYQNFPLLEATLGLRRLELLSAYAGVGFRL